MSYDTESPLRKYWKLRSERITTKQSEGGAGVGSQDSKGKTEGGLAIESSGTRRSVCAFVGVDEAKKAWKREKAQGE